MCPEAEQWYDYEHGLMDASMRVDTERHQAECPDCQFLLVHLDTAARLLDAVARQDSISGGGDPIRDSRCPDPQLPAESRAGALSETEGVDVYAHLLECEACRHYWMEIHFLMQATESEAIPIPSLSVRRQCFDAVRTTWSSGATSGTVTGSSFGGAMAHWLRTFSFNFWLWPVLAAVVLLAFSFSLRSMYIDREVRALLRQADDVLYRSSAVVRYDDLRLSGNLMWSGRATRGGLPSAEETRMDQAEQALQRSLALRPEAAETNHALGRYYLARREWDRAEPYLKKALQLNPHSAPIQSDAGFLVYHRGDFSGAARSFERAMELNPDFSIAVFNAAWLQIKQRHVKEAEDLVNRYQRLDSKSDSYWVQDLQDALERIR